MVADFRFGDRFFYFSDYAAKKGGTTRDSSLRMYSHSGDFFMHTVGLRKGQLALKSKLVMQTGSKSRLKERRFE